MGVVGFLHTADVHVATFERLVAAHAPTHTSTSIVVPELLDRARRRGTDDAPDDQPDDHGIAEALARLVADGAELIVCTCSTIGAAAERIGARGLVAVVRVDRPMVECALDQGDRLGVIATLASTVVPTTELIRQVATDRGVAVDLELRLVADAWDRFEAGDIAAYRRAIASACHDIAPGRDAIVLAQASMAGAVADHVAGVPVLASPAVAVAAAVRRLDTHGDF